MAQLEGPFFHGSEIVSPSQQENKRLRQYREKKRRASSPPSFLRVLRFF
jgi:hypothetical protein